MPRRAAWLLRRTARAAERRIVGDVGVLAYHRVATPTHDPWDLCVSADRFDEQLAVLRDVGTIEPLGAVLGASATARLRRRRPRFAVTFDDGYLDNLTDALPVLERHDAPATVFVPTGMLDMPSFWWDRLTTLALSCQDPAVLWQAAIRIGLAPAGATPADGQHRAVLDALYEQFAPLTPAAAQAAVGRLAREAGEAEPVPDGRPMTTEELRKLAAHPLVTIGIHTVTHSRLSLLPPAAVRDEVTQSARHLEQLLGARPHLFAYPYGDTSPAVADVVRATDVERAVTTDDRWVRLREDPMLIPRLHPHDVDAATFRTWLTAAT
jgi:peptidoglycan/xylan/chitin deacetylase (PgdA/CDA1 family)